MNKNLLLFICLVFSTSLFAQNIAVSNIVPTGHFDPANGCLNGGAPVVVVTFVSSTGSTVINDTLNITDPCGTTTVNLAFSNVRWTKNTNNNWIHGISFPTIAGVTFFNATATSFPSSRWQFFPGGSQSSTACASGILGFPGFYYDGTGQACASCGNAPANDGNPGNNYGDIAADCPVDYAFNINMTLCNNLLNPTGNPNVTNYPYGILGTSDYTTGCWSGVDSYAAGTRINFRFAIKSVTQVFSANPVAAPIVKTCTPTLNYTATYTATCGNGSSVTWWTASSGGTQVGTGSPFIYDPAGPVCPATLYAQCCPIGTTCNTRRAVSPGVCPAALTLNSFNATGATCAIPTATINAVNTSNGNAPLSYTLNPGAVTNTTGIFPGLATGVLYTVLVTDAGGCQATKDTTFLPPTNCCGPAPIPQGPVTYCVGATATQLSATALPTGVLNWYGTNATGGTAVATAPTPSTATAGTFTYYVSQTVSGCESPRASIVVTITPLATITLTSAATTNNQTVCVNSPIVNITYATTNGVTGATVTGLPAGVSGAFNAGTGIVTITGTPTTIGTFNYTVTTTGGCTPPTATGVIIVNPATSVVLTSAAATPNQTVCINTAITNITYTVAGGATGATVAGLPAGVTGAYAAGVFTISGTPTVSGTFNYTVSTTGGCGVATALGTITVTPVVTLTLTSAPATTAQTVCANTAIVNITYTTGSGATGATVTGLPAGVTGTFAGGIFTISGSPTVVGPFSYTVTTTGGCGSASLGGTITVTPGAATLTLSSAPATTTQTVCINTAIANITYVTGGGATGGTVTGLPAGVTGSFLAGIITISGTPTVSGVFTYTASTTGSGSCGSPTQTGTITVNDNATITLTSAPATTTQAVCVNTPITNITYSTANGVTGASVTGLPTGVASSFAGGIFTISGTPTATGVFPYTVNTTGGCATATATGTITVNTLSTITLSSAAATTTQTLCINTALTNITYTTAGGATGASVTGLPAGVNGSFAGGTFTISGTPTASGSFPYTVSTTGGCGVATATGTITVNPNMTIVLTSAPATTSQTVCANIAINNIVYTLGNGATSATVTGLPAGVTGTFAAGVFTISGSPTPVGTFNYTVAATGGCGTASLTGSITVTPGAATLTLSSAPATANQTVCINNAITTITYVTGGGASGGTVTGLPTGVTGTFSGGTITITGTPTVAGIFNYTVTTTGAGTCGSPSLAGVITVNSNATIALSSAVGTDAQTVCINTAITNITYATTNGVTGATVTGLPAGVTGSFAGGVFTISGTPTASGTFNYTITTSGGCTVTTATGTITVSPLTTITLTSAPATSNQTVSINTPITTISYSVANGGTSATVTGLPAGVTGSFAGGIFTITGSPTVVGTFPYTVTTSGGCGIATLTGTIIVNDMVTLTLSSAPGTANQTVCINTAIVNITYAAAGGATGASITAGALPAGLTGVYNAGVFTISGTPTVTGTFNYTVTTSGGVGVASLSSTIIVNPNATLVLSSAAATTAQTLCINTAITNITYTVANGGTGATVTGLPAGVTGSFAGGVFTISGTATVAGTFPYTVTTTGGCLTASLSGTITVNPDATITLSSAAATNAQTICVNTAVTDITYTIAAGGTGATITGLPAGVTGSFAGGVFTISGTAIATGTFAYTITTTGGCSFATATGTIIVNANVTIALSSAAATDAQNLCINTAITNIIYATTNGATGATVTGLPAGVTGSFAGGVFTITGTPSVAGPFSYTVTTTGGCSTATATGTITVNPAATIVLSSAAATAAQTVCINTAITNITYTVANGGTGATVTGLPTGVTGSFAGGVFTITGTPSIAGTFSYTVTTSGGCGTAPISGTITVNANVTLVLTSAAATANQTVCINTAITNIVYTSANGATSASVTGLPAGVTGSFAGGVVTISGSPTVTGTFNYTVTTAGGCSLATQTGSIIVNPNATIALSSAAATAAQTLCINTAITNITYTVANGGTGATVTGLPAGVTGSFAGGVFTISGTATVAGPFTYTVTTTGGCSTATATGSITVNPNATITLSSAAATNAQTICVNTAVTDITYTIAAGGTGATVTGLPAGVTGSFAGGVFTISGTAIATGTFAYTVTTTGGCSFATATGTITVNANVTIALSSAAATAAQNLCINTAITNITYATTNGATGATVTGLPAGVTGSFAGSVFTITGTPTVAGPFSYTITTTGGCSTATATGTITVNPAATIVLSSAAATAAQTVCINTAITNITYTVANGGTGATVTGLPAGVTGSFAGGVFTISGSPTVAGTFSYTVSTSGGCGIAPISGIITVNANVTLVLTSATTTANQTVCINTAIANIVYTSANGATGATVTGLPAGVTGSFAGGVFNISGSPTVTGTFNYTVTTIGGCSLATQSGTIIVNPNATIALSSAAATTAQTLCENNAITNITYTTANGATGATATGLPAGVTGTFAGGVFTISGTPTVAGPFNYTVTTAGGCSSANLTGSITVVAYPNKPIVRSPVFYCPGDAPRPLSDSVTGTNLLWYTTATGGIGTSTPPPVNTSTPGITSYYVSQSNGNCEGPRDTIRVNINNPLSISIGLNDTICEVSSIKYFPVVIPAATSYQWRALGVPNSTIDSVNNINATFSPVNNAQYELTATLGGCSAKDTVDVNVIWKPIVDAGKSVAICLDGSTTLTGSVDHVTGSSNNFTFVWTPKDSLSFDSARVVTAYPKKSTWYRLTVTTDSLTYGCAFSSFDSVKVVVQPTVIAFAGRDTIASTGLPHQLQGSGGTFYEWSTPSNVIISNPTINKPFVTLTNDANFYLRATDAIGCEGFDSVYVKVLNGPAYYVPNAFSPNGDGQNDVFRVVPSGIANTTYFRVFNRYGELMFETNQWLKGWDGTYKGKPQPNGAYVWMVKGTDKNKKIVEMQGTVMLIR